MNPTLQLTFPFTNLLCSLAMYHWAGSDLKWLEIGASFFQHYLLKGAGMWLRQKGLGWIWGWTEWCWDEIGWQADLQRIIVAWKQSNYNCKILGYVHKRNTRVDFVRVRWDRFLNYVYIPSCEVSVRIVFLSQLGRNFPEHSWSVMAGTSNMLVCGASEPKAVLLLSV